MGRAAVVSWIYFVLLCVAAEIGSVPGNSGGFTSTFCGHSEAGNARKKVEQIDVWHSEVIFLENHGQKTTGN